MLGRKMRMLKHQDMEALDWQVRLWLGKRRIPLQDYRNLPPHCKVSLDDGVCGGTRPPSDRQLRELAQELHLSNLRLNGYSTSPVEFWTTEELRKFFSLTPDETHEHLSKF